MWDPNKFLLSLVKMSLKNDVSDIHINPKEDYVLIRFRKAQDLIPFFKITKSDHEKLANIIKNKWDISDQSDGPNHPKTGKINLEIPLKKKTLKVNLRVSTLDSLYGDNIVMRVLLEDKSRLNIDNLGFIDQNIRKIKKIKKLNSWLILTSGQTGAGKTTTLYSMLQMFDPQKKSIYTLEDPIEFQIDGYIQSQIDWTLSSEQFQQTFTKWIKGILKQDPNIIMVWEIKEKESASVCLEAANTGHIVMGSIHANDGISVISRLNQLGVESYLISAGLKYIIHQKIVRKLCPECHETINAQDHEYLAGDIDAVDKKIGTQTGLDNILDERATWYDMWSVNHDGCEKCSKWYKWLTIVAEIVKVDDTISQMIFENKSIRDIQNYLDESVNYISMYENAILKSRHGLIDFREALKIKEGNG